MAWSEDDKGRAKFWGYIMLAILIVMLFLYVRGDTKTKAVK